jgi:hypothetical protein
MNLLKKLDSLYTGTYSDWDVGHNSCLDDVIELVKNEKSKYRDFEDFLSWKHAEDYSGCDDDMPDHCNDWITNLDNEEIIKYANEYKNA